MSFCMYRSIDLLTKGLKFYINHVRNGNLFVLAFMLSLLFLPFCLDFMRILKLNVICSAHSCFIAVVLYLFRLAILLLLYQ